MNQTDHVRLIEFFKCIIECAARSFSSETLSPILSGEGPANFKCRPAHRIKKANATHEVTARFLLYSKVSIAAHLPMSDMEREITPRFQPVKRFTTQVTHDLRI